MSDGERSDQDLVVDDGGDVSAIWSLINIKPTITNGAPCSLFPQDPITPPSRNHSPRENGVDKSKKDHNSSHRCVLFHENR